MRTFFSRFGRFIWRAMIIFSFLVNIILVVVLLGLGLLIFDIKNNIADPLVGGLHGSFVGLDQATIDWTIPVRDTIPVQLTVPLNTDTTVVLTRPVPISANATIVLNGSSVSTPVSLTLPVGLNLPVHLDLDVPIDEQLDVALDVRAVIPLGQTQLHDVADNLRLLFEPLAVALDNLPGDFGEAGTFVTQVVAGTAPNLLEPDEDFAPWPGFSRTAGLNYDLYAINVPGSNRPVSTGIVPEGGIPLLDEQTRPDVYQQGGPQQVNQTAETDMARRGIASMFYDGQIGAYIAEAQRQAAAAPLESLTQPPGEAGSSEPETAGP
ncbi:MAG: hypothetical protein CL610_17010 [Anaerolineaceae bacterium]|nr:hypothetical protein [Anaerolineaceae bacterium]